ncbi:MAG: prenyltransferase [Syntrophorhabdus sp. PtaB.Bin006]|nr:MAG: prenyltransferase [Syntrophorhabdus sp. PtaB.Bin006]
MRLKDQLIKPPLGFVNHYLGWRNWSVLTYNSAIENVFPIFYIALYDRLFSFRFIIDFFAFFLFSVLSTTYGYLINDFSDRDLDRSHGKANTFADDSPLKAALIVAFFLALSVVFGSNFVGKQHFLPLWLGWFFIATFYSLRPIRLKERGKIGLAFVVVAQRVVPTLIVFAAFTHWDPITVFVFTLYMLFRGLSSDVNHQLEDYHKDLVTGTRTCAVQSGFEATSKLFRLSLEMEKVLLFFCLFLMYLKLTTYRAFGVSLALPPLVVYAVLVVTAWIRARGKGTDADINPFAPGRKDLFQFLHHGFPSVALPLYLLFLLILESWVFFAILIFFIAYRRLYSAELVLNSFPARMLRRVFAILH